MKTVCKEIFWGRALPEWQDGYRRGSLQPRNLVNMLGLRNDDPAWIEPLDEARLEAQLEYLAERLESVDGDLSRLPLYGIPFAVKDNIDVRGWRTTAACPEFGYIATHDATVVKRLRDAGAIVAGKTNLDQFATGLVGTRSPYGVVPNAFRPEYISGGSSSGSASVTARGIVPFALGTDTAGSGRVPAGMNNLVGLKPTRGRLSIDGVVPACRTLDCVSILALTVEDAEFVARIAEGFNPADPYSRVDPGSAPLTFPERTRFGVPRSPEFFGDAEAAAHYERCLDIAREMDVDIVPLDFTPFLQMADLLYGGPWIAERFTVVQTLWERNPKAIHPVVRAIVEKAAAFSAADAFRAEYRRAELMRQIEEVMKGIHALMVPTVPAAFTIEEALKDPIALNSRLGIYTNFVNFADMCALALPSGMRKDGLPAGITLLAPAWHDTALAEFGCRWERALSRQPEGLLLGATGNAYAAPQLPASRPSKHTVRLAVVGAHLRGMPLNHQLTSRGAAFVESTQTAEEYRLFSLASGTPPKPGLVRVSDGEQGASIAVEVWEMPISGFGEFTAEVPPPLGIGNLRLCDGRTVKGFICEPYVLAEAKDITSFGGWRAYIGAL